MEGVEWDKEKLSREEQGMQERGKWGFSWSGSKPAEKAPSEQTLVESEGQPQIWKNGGRCIPSTRNKDKGAEVALGRVCGKNQKGMIPDPVIQGSLGQPLK